MLAGIVPELHSSFPFVRQFGGEMRCSIFFRFRVFPLCFSVVFFHISDVKIDPLSVMMSRGSPCSRNISLTNRSENCRAVMSLVQVMK